MSGVICDKLHVQKDSNNIVNVELHLVLHGSIFMIHLNQENLTWVLKHLTAVFGI